MFAPRQAYIGVTVTEMCRKMGISDATYYNWKKKYGGLGVPELRRLKQLKAENQHLKQLVADLSPDKQQLQDVPEQPGIARRPADAGPGAQLYSACRNARRYCKGLCCRCALKSLLKYETSRKPLS